MSAMLMNAEIRTSIEAFKALRLPQEAVDFVHLAQCSFRPSFLLDDAFDFFAKWSDTLWICREEEEHLGEALESDVNKLC